MYGFVHSTFLVMIGLITSKMIVVRNIIGKILRYLHYHLMNRILLVLFFFLSLKVWAQEPVHKIFPKFSNETIFSFGNLKANSTQVENIVRFSSFFHVGIELHYNLNRNIGCNSGLVVRNIGFIHELNDSIRIKNRSYSLGIPACVNIHMSNVPLSFTLGSGIEFLFAYKQKVFFKNEKRIYHAWISDRVNLINPSLQASIHYLDRYIKFKYYLLDFLNHKKHKLNLNGLEYDLSITQSALCYISIGRNVSSKNIPFRSNTMYENEY